MYVIIVEPFSFAYRHELEGQLPETLNHDELVRLFMVTSNIKHRGCAGLKSESVSSSSRTVWQ
ncbi:MAG: hypothetical protein OXI81_21715 [Paracoccaceae bacterium]|nr:hypothetical protein [Paracoccaceae bacterium]